MPQAEQIRVEVAYVDPERQFLRAVTLARGATVADAIQISGLSVEIGRGRDIHDVGIWSKPATMTTRLADGDRVEIYRPLQIDPKAARRARIKRKA